MWSVLQAAYCLIFTNCKRSISKPCVTARKLRCRDEGPGRSHKSVPANKLQVPSLPFYASSNILGADDTLRGPAAWPGLPVTLRGS